MAPDTSAAQPRRPITDHLAAASRKVVGKKVVMQTGGFAMLVGDDESDPGAGHTYPSLYQRMKRNIRT